ncbi:MAG: hypothetical protein JSU86_14265 [Phycisphaerales bacterium]|nr:MAG: hypothetical protein JSU86_14265 [Phycisphaerales bacterium]
MIPQAHITAWGAIVQAGLDSNTAVGQGRSHDAKHRDLPPQRPLVDSSAFSVFWAGETCPLRRTILFHLAERPAGQPNQYITADQLLRDVWDGGVKSPDTIRNAVRPLRQRLSSAGMKDLAAAIHGTGGRYGLILDARRPPRKLNVEVMDRES